MVKIRKANEKDVPDIAELIVALVLETEPVIPNPEISIGVLLDIKKTIDEYYVAEADGFIVGLLCLTSSTKFTYKARHSDKAINIASGLVSSGYVKPDYRRKKIMFRLFALLEADAKKKKLDYVYVTTRYPEIESLLGKREYEFVGTELNTDKLKSYFIGPKVYRKEL